MLYGHITGVSITHVNGPTEGEINVFSSIEAAEEAIKDYPVGIHLSYVVNMSYGPHETSISERNIILRDSLTVRLVSRLRDLLHNPRIRTDQYGETHATTMSSNEMATWLYALNYTLDRDDLLPEPCFIIISREFDETHLHAVCKTEEIAVKVQQKLSDDELKKKGRNETDFTITRHFSFFGAPIMYYGDKHE